jgi:hypothetical protein
MYLRQCYRCIAETPVRSVFEHNTAVQPATAAQPVCAAALLACNSWSTATGGSAFCFFKAMLQCCCLHSSWGCPAHGTCGPRVNFVAGGRHAVINVQQSIWQPCTLMRVPAHHSQAFEGPRNHPCHSVKRSSRVMLQQPTVWDQPTPAFFVLSAMRVLRTRSDSHTSLPFGFKPATAAGMLTDQFT